MRARLEARDCHVLRIRHTVCVSLHGSIRFNRPAAYLEKCKVTLQVVAGIQRHGRAGPAGIF